MKSKSKNIFFTVPIPILIPVLVLTTFIFSSQTVWGGDHSLIPLSDEELSEIYGAGLYFRVDLSLEVLSANDTPPQVVVNTGTPIMIPTNTTSNFSGTGGSISLSGNAQSNVSSLINVIGAASVINVGVNVVSITNSSSDTIYTTNINTGAQGSGVTLNVPLMP
jgi:hypothetical protein